ncbi:hypothetical protein [uncultured Clostridium sp.]|uniref:hypothetical protein n=1 Tax=uncultured Clostridium sp. TaxID=59620 RepID=UPI002630E8EE|nr:hypothetical protein [uncultured Clostridium sp.]
MKLSIEEILKAIRDRTIFEYDKDDKKDYESLLEWLEKIGYATNLGIFDKKKTIIAGTNFAKLTEKGKNYLNKK